ncbi:hypothetical protein [Cellulomonas marina]|uniref:Mannosyltransferase (PIG-V) n=1 Tax=Cellulomonas marina TaxID=988821 RepID=A0A1I0Y0H8_9CELL|nr:hypothetical protein [Cellulomonas marina]GIG28455.1 hypothetical protein Cma02nite_10550 [Cellulomonas marina]SFB05978.1 hypothetical protein SAMN05421867_10663 [Cellulomonas marina]
MTDVRGQAPGSAIALLEPLAPRPASRPRLTARTVLVLLAVYAGARVLSALLLLVVHRTGVVDDGPGGLGAGLAATLPGTGFTDLLQGWDGEYYRRIAEDGYPTDLPLDADGEVAKNPWAFMPVYPLLARGVMAVTGLGFGAAGTAVALLAGAAAVIVLHVLLLPHAGRRAATLGAVLLAISPMSFLFTVTYAESTFLVLVFGALVAMTRQRYALFAVLGVVAAFTRPGALALAFALVLLHLVRARRGLVQHRREHVAALGAATAVTLAGLAWPVVAGLVTGRADAYLATETAWQQEYTGHAGFVPFTPWFRFASAVLDPVLGPGAGVVLVTLLLGTTVVVVARRWNAPGADLTVWAVAYLAYLVAVFVPQHSTFRLLLPLAPALGDPGLTGTRRRAALAVGASLALQPVAVLALWVVVAP